MNVPGVLRMAADVVSIDRKKRSRLLVLVVVLAPLIGCGKKESSIASFSELSGGTTFAVPTGTAADQFVLKRFPDAKMEYYNSALDCALAVSGGKADAAVYDLPVLKNIAAQNEGLVILKELVAEDRYGFAVQLSNTALKQTIDSVLAEIKADGTYDDMLRRWLPDRGAPAPMPDIPLAGSNGVLRFGTAAVTAPMAFVDARRKVVGFDVEFATYVARKLGKKLEVTDMEFGGMLPALIAGKVDMIGAGLSITAERAKQVLYSESYFPSGLAVVVNAGVSATAVNGPLKMRGIEDISDKRIGVLVGSVYDTYATKKYPNAQILQYANVSDKVVALNTDKVDVLFYDQASVPDVLRTNPNIWVLAKDFSSIPIGAGFNSENDALREQFNAFLKLIRANGVYDDMVNRWMNKGILEMPDIVAANPNGVLRAGVVNDLGMPFGLIHDGKLIGFDIELSGRFAAYIGRTYEPVPLQFGSLIASISTGKIDIITASMYITAEREKMIDFSDPYYESGASLLARKDRIASYAAPVETVPASETFLKRVADRFYSNIVLEHRYRLIIGGIKLTILISIFSALLGTILGALICYMRMSRNLFISDFAATYIWLLRGTPVLVLLMIIYYVVFASVNINPAIAAVFAFGMNFGAYVSEMFRTSIQSIDRGQKEAGTAGGFTKFQAFVYIVLPQALRHLLPVYKGEFISMVKMTSIVGYIAVQDITKVSDIIRSRTFDAFFPLITATMIYLSIAWLLTWGLSKIEISVDPRQRKRNPLPEASR
ncbi:MAG: ABC transporter substrate-binding protein/permease [Acidobacteriota bacterium]